MTEYYHYPTVNRSQIQVSGKNVLTISFFSSSLPFTTLELSGIMLKAMGTGESRESMNIWIKK